MIGGCFVCVFKSHGRCGGNEECRFGDRVMCRTTRRPTTIYSPNTSHRPTTIHSPNPSHVLHPFFLRSPPPPPDRLVGLAVPWGAVCSRPNRPAPVGEPTAAPTVERHPAGRGVQRLVHARQQLLHQVCSAVRGLSLLEHLPPKGCCQGGGASPHAGLLPRRFVGDWVGNVATVRRCGCGFSPQRRDCDRGELQVRSHLMTSLDDVT